MRVGVVSIDPVRVSARDFGAVVDVSSNYGDGHWVWS